MSQFVDECGLNVKGGDGGAGCVAFRREAHVDKGGPDGGDGGDGGSIFLVADHNIASLLAFRDYPHRKAPSGSHGGGKKQHGAGGDDVEVRVPVGTVVRDQQGNLFADLNESGARWMAARGGEGGKGNARFLSNRLRVPKFAEQGEAGEEQWLVLELKLLADVALVGFPNAGKSTLISRISAAKPKIADYPFTTLTPNLGVVQMGDTDLVVADIPGLIEGAHEGKGLGHQFLRHIERARVLAVLIDLVPYDGRTPQDQYDQLMHELEQYRPDLLDRPRMVIATKADVAVFDPPEGALLISSVTGEGLEQVKGRMADLVVEARDVEIPHAGGYVVHRPVPEGVQIERTDDGGYLVLGRDAERAVSLNDLTNIEALEYAQRRLQKIGVFKALARAGAKDGAIVYVGDTSFEYFEDDFT